MGKVNNFLKISSVYGDFIVNRHCTFQAEALIKTGRTHIEKELQRIFSIVDTLPQSALIIDGGTNIGFFSIPVAERVKQKKSIVIGFETQRLIYYAVAGAVALNDLENCFLFNLGLSDKAGAASVPTVDYSKSFDFGTIGIIDKPELETLSADPRLALNDNTIRTIAIDLLNLPRLDFIKLDVEGHECQALRGGAETIRKFRPYIWAEYFLIGQQSIIDALSGIEDYEFHVMDYQNMLCVPKEKTLEIKGIFK